MPDRQHPPSGAPCWADLWTSDVERARKFYAELLGWEAQEPSAEFGGYFMFTRNGVPVAGCMGDMGDMKANDSWKIYLATPDIDATVRAAEAAGATIVVPPSPVADLGTQAVMVDPAGAAVGTWQVGTFPGFTVLNEDGAPSWFELHTRDHPTAVDFYRKVFDWQTDVVSDTDEFRYSTMRNPDGEGELAGVMDAGGFLPPDAPSSWSIYWEVDDIVETVAAVRDLGGSIVTDVQETPYGRLAEAKDPAGAVFKLRTPPR